MARNHLPCGLAARARLGIARPREAVREAKVGDGIRFTGRIDGLPAYLSAFDIVVVSSDNEAFTLGLARLLGDESLRRRLGAAARDEVTVRFEREQVVGRIEALYRASGDRRGGR